MPYIIIDQEDLNMVNPTECPEGVDVPGAVLERIRNGRNPRVFREVEYGISVKVKEVTKDETVKSKTLDDQGPGGKGDGEVQRGDKTTPESKH